MKGRLIYLNAELLSIGTELLLGDILNTNAQYIARRLADNGIFVYYQTVVGDNPERMKKSLEIAFSRADLVITTGGLGPTKDDLTKKIAAEFFDRKMVMNKPAMEKIEAYFNKSNRPMTENNRRQAYFPEDSIIVPNPNGTAPGCIIDDGRRILVMMPGPPREMRPMLEEQILPYLSKYQHGVLVSKVLRVIGLGESMMEDKIKDLMDAQTNPTIAPYAKDGEAILRITAKAKDEEEAKKLIIPVENAITKRLGDNIYAAGETSLEEVVVKMLIEKKFTLAAAESCTGGLLCSRLVRVPGVSSVLKEGAVTYSNDAKMRRLNVRFDTLNKFGAVSAETAAEMAEGIAKTAKCDIGLSVTGIAGPDGGTEDKPVGLVYVGLYINGKVQTRKFNFPGNRQNVQNRTVMSALDWLRRELLK